MPGHFDAAARVSDESEIMKSPLPRNYLDGNIDLRDTVPPLPFETPLPSQILSGGKSFNDMLQRYIRRKIRRRKKQFCPRCFSRHCDIRRGVQRDLYTSKLSRIETARDILQWCYLPRVLGILLVY